MPLLDSLYATHLEGARRHTSRAKSLCLRTVEYIRRNNSPWSIHKPFCPALLALASPFFPSSSQKPAIELWASHCHLASVKRRAPTYAPLWESVTTEPIVLVPAVQALVKFQMPAALSKHSPTRPKEKNFFLISGLPPDCDWRTLKDIARQFTTNQPGWTEVDPRPWKLPEGRKGYFSVRTDEEAERVYELMRRSKFDRTQQPLLLHHFDVSQDRPRLIRCNCQDVYPELRGHSFERSNICPQSVFSALEDKDPFFPLVSSPPVRMTAPMYPSPIQMPVAPYPPPYPAVAMPPAMPPSYRLNEHGIPVNVAKGSVSTEPRSVLIRGLDYSVTETELRTLLSQYGNPLRIHLKNGYAVAVFSTAREVNTATARLHGKEYKGRILKVREGRDTTPISEPVIVHGGPRGVS
ncbi:hypothetical protein IWZ03DRAFT_381472 [Phyllosticta citriasiana]|uniref:RRM domain-containing protein n=1 Tax=Phyllosticta citriasiana TaxID=595635 RepID=A0ABR1KKG9_9PEZI